jgi:putrescine aminotransferase
VLLGKALGGGVVPVAAVVATADLHEPLAKDPTWHSATFGGHPLGCAAARAALAAVDDLAERAAEVSARFEAGLRRQAEGRTAIVTDVRGAGLLWGIEFATPGMAGSALVELGQRGLLVSPCLSSPRTIRLLPPMVATDEQVDRALELLAGALDEAESFAADEPE